MVDTKSSRQEDIKQAYIPSYLIRDIIGGKPYYYKGYKEVLNKTKTIHDIMPSSTLQSFIIMYINYLLIQALGIKKYHIFTSETGSHLAKNENYGLDLAVYDKKTLPNDKIGAHFATVPPLLVVEVDIKIELEDSTDLDFISKKTQSLLDFGTKKVIWITSKTKKVLIAEKGKDWILRDWDQDMELMKGVIANIGKYLKENDVVIEN